MSQIRRFIFDMFSEQVIFICNLLNSAWKAQISNFNYEQKTRKFLSRDYISYWPQSQKHERVIHRYMKAILNTQGTKSAISMNFSNGHKRNL